MKAIQSIMATILIALAPTCYGQHKTDSAHNKTRQASRFAVGYHLNQFQNDFGIGWT